MLSEAVGTLVVIGLLVLFIGIPIYCICQIPDGLDPVTEPAVGYSRA